MKNQISLKGKYWNQPEKAQNLEQVCEQILAEQGVEFYDDVERFLHPTAELLHDPWSMKGIPEAVNRIEKAIQNRERIIVFGDFDSDGVTSTVILVRAIQKLGGLVSYRIPSREKDSHGLKKYFLDDLKEKGVSLVITCDCGINDYEEVQHGVDLGMDIIVTDHHQSDVERYPKAALAVVNPLQTECEYPDKHMSGAGIALKLVMALAEQMIEEEEEREEFLSPLIEMCGIGLIADCMELVGENRVLAKMAVERMKETQWPGLAHLFERLGVVRDSINEETVGFTIAPRINASSRVGDVLMAVQLFLGDKNKVDEKFRQLETWNEERKILTQEYMEESKDQIGDGSCNLLFAPHWRAGILGLIAGRHSESTGKPTIAMSQKNDELIGASCRAPEGYDMGAALQSCADLFVHFGGHEGAAGFVAKKENKEKIEKALDEFFSKNKQDIPPTKLMAWVGEETLQPKLLDFLRLARPFGAGNREPIFGMNGVVLKEIKYMGELQNHARIMGEKDGNKYSWVGFFAADTIQKMKLGKSYDIAFTVAENHWNGKVNLQMRLADVREV